jgi:lipopolysaccharide/colanic/teichoic acid biosynthesis glycosyltransferase
MQKIGPSQRLTALLLAAADSTVLAGAVVAAAWIRFGGELFAREFGKTLDHPWFIAYAILAQILLSTTFDLYRPQSWRTRDYVLLRMAALAVSLAVALALGVYMVPPWRFGRGLLALTLVIALPAQAALRFLWLAVAALPHPRRATLIGDGPIVAALEEELRRRPNAPIRIVNRLPAPTDSVPAELRRAALTEVDLVVVASLAHDATVDRLAALNFRGMPVVDAAGAYAALTGRIPVRQVDSRWFIATGDFSSLATTPFHQLQRILDVLIASLLLLLSSPILLAAAAVVLLTDGPPVLYRQLRLGRYGKPFSLVKLRTMQRGSDESGPTFAEKNDRRVLPAARLLRRWRIDELPQLVNVLRGEMSLVGPRPERPEVAADLEQQIPFYAFRYSVRPGITGWAQVHLPYCSSIDDHLAKLEFDLYHLRHYGPAMYAIVLIRTLGALVFRPGR